MKLKKTVWVMIACVLLYPASLLGYTWFCVAQMALPGGSHGPLDAYRHTLASALLAHTLSPAAVDAVTAIMEKSGTAANQMDQHNNRIGAIIGTQAQTLGEIEPMVRTRVLQGKINAMDAQQSTWLPSENWKKSLVMVKTGGNKKMGL